jgi:hypothetical protein
VTQNEATDQQQTTSAAASGAPPFDSPQTFLAWIAVIAGNIGATVQTVYQYDEATCLDHCTGDAQTQDIAQAVVTDQNANAFTDGRAPPPSAASSSGATPEPGLPVAPAPDAPAQDAPPPAVPVASSSSAARAMVASAPSETRAAVSPDAAPTARVAGSEASLTQIDIAWTPAPQPAQHAHAAVAPRGGDVPPSTPSGAHFVSSEHVQAHKEARLPLAELPALPRAALEAIRTQPGHGPDGAWLAAGVALLAGLVLVRRVRRQTM